MSKEIQLAVANQMVLILWEKDLISTKEKDEIIRKNELKFFEN
jgi:hypothetical protein